VSLVVIGLLALFVIGFLASGSDDDSTALSDSLKPRQIYAGVSQSPSKWVCDDPDMDKHAELVGDDTLTPIAEADVPWIEVEQLTLSQDGSTLTIVWDLAGAVPDDVGSAPVWGDWIAAWVVNFYSRDFKHSTQVAIAKAGAEPAYLDNSRHDLDSNDVEVFDPNADGATAVFNDDVITITVPLRYLERTNPDPVILAGAVFESPQGDVDNGDFFGGWVYNDSACEDGPSEDWPIWYS
jgi:hypothetical protein